MLHINREHTFLRLLLFFVIKMLSHTYTNSPEINYSAPNYLLNSFKKNFCAHVPGLLWETLREMLRQEICSLALRLYLKAILNYL